ncbi:MAG: LCP family protein [Eubacterium sp.]|nr:LCP family protein [Eubacterium sp.]
MLQFITSAALFIQLLFMDILPAKYLIGFGILAVVFFVLVMVSTKNKKASILFMVLSLIVALIMVWSIRALMKLDDTIAVTSTEDSSESVLVDVVVLDSDEATEIEDIAGYDLGYTQDDDAILTALGMVESDLGTTVASTAYEGATAVAFSLIEGKQQAIVIEDSYLEILGEIDEFSVLSDGIRIIKSYEISADSEEESANYDTEQETQSGDDTMVVYISGIDTYGTISVKSRSDVNILAIINQSTGKILLVNTPRDSYVQLPLSSSSYDKLTHAGLYGVDVSKATLENLYGIDIDYYVRVNFTGFESIIDALGSITVNSDYSFTTTKGGYWISEGENTLTGAQALSFARERKAFADGDYQRGKNQMEVIRAVIEKMQSSDMLLNFSELMDEISESFQTDMTSDEIYEVVKRQIDEGTEWEIETYTLTGTGGKSTTYTIPNARSYVIYPDDESLEEAKELIKETLGTDE